MAGQADSREVGWCSGDLVDEPIGRRRWVVIDTETTGLSMTRDELREFAACVLDPRCETIEACCEWSADEGVEALQVLVARVGRALAGGVLVAHNLEFDLAFLGRHEATRETLVAEPRRWLCTMRAAGGFVSLDALAEGFGVKLTGRHTAAGDARALAEILRQIVGAVREMGADSVESLCEVATLRCRCGDGPGVVVPRSWAVVAESLPRVAPVRFPSPQQRAIVAAVGERLYATSGSQISLAAATQALEAAGLSAISLGLVLADLDRRPSNT